MTAQEAKNTIEELKVKSQLTKEEMELLKQAIKVLAGSFAIIPE